VRALLLSAYAAESHTYWQRSLQQMFPGWDWACLELPPRYFSWRVRGNPLYWSLAERETLQQDRDLLIATSMVDLATLRGLVPALATVPTLLYFHENQFDYPQQRQQHSLLEAQMVSLYSALAADRIAFNSAYNRDTFISGCRELLARMPDKVPPRIPELLQAKSTVLPVPLLPQRAADMPCWPGEQGAVAERPLRILWSARFEHDKGGEGLHAVLQQLEAAGLEYELAVTGQQFRNSPAIFTRIEAEFGHRLVQFGYLESATDYAGLQQGADIVLSTAVHEFQGLAVLQAVQAGCVPVVPDRLAYRELYPERYRYTSSPESPRQEARAAASMVVEIAADICRGAVSAPDVSQFSLASIEQAYSAELQLLAAAQDSQ
jgi:glycosyltransferase involved in cell wall biosynthesis